MSKQPQTRADGELAYLVQFPSSALPHVFKTSVAHPQGRVARAGTHRGAGVIT